jgi:hypothetical protein
MKSAIFLLAILQLSFWLYPNDTFLSSLVSFVLPSLVLITYLFPVSENRPNHPPTQ